MAARIPEKFKAADIARFAQRAFQVEPHKPAIAYWAYYYIVQQILEKNLHTADDSCREYTTNLMDKLEQMKNQYSADETITDDLAGQAYVEQFGMEIFQRADNAVIANKTTRTTGDNFWTAATFLDLLHIWGNPSPDVAQKIKYAKVQAARIFKAIKAGEDPNLSNPAPQPVLDAHAPALDPNDPDVERINSAAAAQPSVDETPAESQPAQTSPAHEQPQPISPPEPAHPGLSPPPQPSVVEVPDEHDRLQQKLAKQSYLDESLHTSRAPSVPRPEAPEQPPGNISGQPSPVPQPREESQPFVAQPDPNVQMDSFQGSYFPETGLPEAPSNPTGVSGGAGWAGISPSHGVPSPSGNAQPVYRNPPAQPPAMPPPTSQTQPPIQPAFSAPPPAQMQQPPQVFYQQPQPQQQQPQPVAPQAVPRAAAQAPAQSYVTDDAAMTAAQKHAKFAISALNFEDVPTAVKELREALRSLGAS